MVANFPYVHELSSETQRYDHSQVETVRNVAAQCVTAEIIARLILAVLLGAGGASEIE